MKEWASGVLALTGTALLSSYRSQGRTSAAGAGCLLPRAALGLPGSSISSGLAGCRSHSNMLSSIFTACIALSPALSCTADCH